METLITALVAFIMGGLLGLTAMAVIASQRDRRAGGDSFHQPLRPLRGGGDDLAAPRPRRY